MVCNKGPPSWWIVFSHVLISVDYLPHSSKLSLLFSVYKYVKNHYFTFYVNSNWWYTGIYKVSVIKFITENWTKLLLHLPTDGVRSLFYTFVWRLTCFQDYWLLSKLRGLSYSLILKSYLVTKGTVQIHVVVVLKI